MVVVILLWTIFFPCHFLSLLLFCAYQFCFVVTLLLTILFRCCYFASICFVLLLLLTILFRCCYFALIYFVLLLFCYWLFYFVAVILLFVFCIITVVVMCCSIFQVWFKVRQESPWGVRPAGWRAMDTATCSTPTRRSRLDRLSRNVTNTTHLHYI